MNWPDERQSQLKLAQVSLSGTMGLVRPPYCAHLLPPHSLGSPGLAVPWRFTGKRIQITLGFFDLDKKGIKIASQNVKKFSRIKFARMGSPCEMQIVSHGHTLRGGEGISSGFELA